MRVKKQINAILFKKHNPVVNLLIYIFKMFNNYMNISSKSITAGILFENQPFLEISEIRHFISHAFILGFFSLFDVSNDMFFGF